jgi:outer membrane lipoprotein-sorting protein
MFDILKGIFFLLTVSISLELAAQRELSEGVITFSQTMSSTNEQMNAQLSMLGDLTTTTYFKKDKSRTELSNPMMGDVTSIFNTENGQMMMVMNNPMMGKVYTIGSIPGSEQLPDGITIKKGDEVRSLQGYDCQQYLVNMSQEGVDVEIEMYVTPLIKALNKETLEYLGDFDGGFPLFFKVDSRTPGFEITMTQEVTSIKSQQVDDSKFEMTPPDGYKKVDSIPGM